MNILMKRMWIWGGLFVLLVLIASNMGEQARIKTIKLTQIPEVVPIRQVINNSIGVNTNRSAPYVRHIIYKSGKCVAELNADYHYDRRMLRGAVIFKTINIFENVSRETDVFNKSDALEKITLKWYYPIPYPEGHTEDVPVISVGVSRDKIEKTDWSQIKIADLPGVVDSYWESPDFKSKKKIDLDTY